MKGLANNRYVDALLKFILLSAMLHIFILAIYSIKSGQTASLNYITILDLNLLFPNILQNNYISYVSMAFAIALYSAIFFFLTKKAT